MDERKQNSGRTFGWFSVVAFLCIVGFLILVAIPNFVHDGRKDPMMRCINNLRQIDAATQQWALEHLNTNSDTVVTWNDVAPYLHRGFGKSLKPLFCPQDRTKTFSNSYALGDWKSPPKCKIKPSNHIFN